MAKPSKEQERKTEISRDRGSGLAIGIALGVVFGILLDNIAIGIAIGIAMGIAIGAGLETTESKKGNKSRKNKSK